MSRAKNNKPSNTKSKKEKDFSSNPQSDYDNNNAHKNFERILNKHKDKLEVTKRKPPEKNKDRVHFETYPPLKEAMDRAANEKKENRVSFITRAVLMLLKAEHPHLFAEYEAEMEKLDIRPPGPKPSSSTGKKNGTPEPT